MAEIKINEGEVLFDIGHGALGGVAVGGFSGHTEASPYNRLTAEQWEEHSVLSRQYGSQGVSGMGAGAYERLLELEALANQ